MSASRSKSIPPRLAYNLREAAAAIGVSYLTIYRQIQDGKINASKVRGRIVVTAESLNNMLAQGHAEVVSSL